VSEVITELNNPLTSNYLQFKELVSSDTFNWSRQARTMTGSFDNENGRIVPLKEEDFVWFSHVFVRRPQGFVNSFVPVLYSDFAELALQVVGEILTANKILGLCVYRMNANLTQYQGGDQPRRRSPLHTDLEFLDEKTGNPNKGYRSIEHKILLIYLNSFSEGETAVEIDGVEYLSKPAEDKVITFNGKHLHAAYMPSAPQDQRMVLNVAYHGIDR
jgi:hypothetical protein